MTVNVSRGKHCLTIQTLHLVFELKGSGKPVEEHKYPEISIARCIMENRVLVLRNERR
jgi:hypothetical protein